MTIFSDSDLDFFRQILKEVSEIEIIPRFRGLGNDDVVEKKSSIDLVMDADILTEKRLSRHLRSLYPEALVVGEEACEADPSLLGHIADAGLAFVIDPVDGTFNFAAGLPLFGTILSVVSKGETIAGVIHDPVSGDTLIASKGAGARLVRDSGNRPIHVLEPRALSAMVGTISINDAEPETRRRIGANLSKIRMAFGYNCSAYEYWMAATGKVDFIGHFKLMPWDHLAGILIHAEAGGYSAHHDGSPFRVGNMTGGILSAPDKDSWKVIAEAILRA